MAKFGAQVGGSGQASRRPLEVDYAFSSKTSSQLHFFVLKMIKTRS